MDKTFKLFTDGGARGNPGNSAIGYIIFENNFLIDFYCEYTGISTNNQAEYTALKLGIKRCIELKIKNLNCFLDSELVVRQLNGIYKVKNEEISIIKSEIDILKDNFDNINFNHIKRVENKFADKLVNLALNNKLSSK